MDAHALSKEERQLLDEKYAGNAAAEGFKDDRKRLAAGEPLAYVIGWQPFLGLKIYLDSRPLIPRPETEWWTEELIKHLNERFGDAPFRLLDLCAGSGAIGIAVLAMMPGARVSFGELR
jgi:release factor glutamine methyltransferase